MGTPREDALDIFSYALKVANVGRAMEQRVRFNDEGTMEIDDRRYVLREYRKLILIALGKAAAAMTVSFLRCGKKAVDRFEGVIVTPDPFDAPSWRFKSFCGGHPTPNVASMEAAEEIQRLLTTLTQQDLVVFLISGGGSSLVEQFLLPNTSLETIAGTHKALVESGAPITAMNAVRKHLSSVKGGRLAALAAPAEQLTIVISDVPVGALDAISSGPTTPDRSTVEEVYRIAEEYRLVERLPAAIGKKIESRALPETPKPGDSIFGRSHWSVLLDSSSLEAAAAKRAAELGWHVEIDDTCDDWNAEQAATYLVERARTLRRERGRVCLLSAGEVAVAVAPGATGKGGRNQHFALLASKLIAADSITVLSAGSDGIDGNSPAAGAVVDGETLARAAREGYPVDVALSAFDSYSLFSLLADAITTGPTRNNLRDLRVLLAS
jgi:hydroxypyruvate reductase